MRSAAVYTTQRVAAAHAHAIRQLNRRHKDEWDALDAKQAREVRGQPSPYGHHGRDRPSRWDWQRGV